ncbi:hypothetical protein ACOSP7_010192 [Xanthoceras sorbifolium]
MLAKQCWRLITNPSSLVARVLKSVYFPRGDYLHASIGSSASFVWRSLMWGRKLIEMESRWRIEDGTATFVYSNKWLPRPSRFQIYSPILLDPMAKVADMKSSSGGWNSNLIWSSFLPDDAKLILNLPCSSTLHPDSLIWHFDKMGNYNVKSGYWVAMEQKSLSSAATCSGMAGINWWKHIWQLKLPSKIKIFL